MLAIKLEEGCSSPGSSNSNILSETFSPSDNFAAISNVQD